MFNRIIERIREVIRKLTSKSIEQALSIKPTVSSEMAEAIQLWGNMYQNKPPWKKEPTPHNPERVTTLGLPAFIASEKARMCTLEMKSEITAPMEETEEVEKISGLSYTTKQAKGSTERAEFLNKQYQNTIMRDIRTQLEYGLAKGGLVIKPYVVFGENGTEDKIVMDYIQADDFYPISFDVSGRITAAAFVQRIIDKDYVYSRLEYHKLEGTTVTVVNKAFRNSVNAARNTDDLGTEIPLTSVPEWAAVEPETIIKNVDRLLFAYFKTPLANTVDTYSPLGMSVYGRAADLIKDADEQYSRTLWEYEGSELAVDIDSLVLKQEEDKNHNVIYMSPTKQNRLFRGIDNNDEAFYNVFNPTIRDASLFNGLNEILMRIEDVCELARGTIADVDKEARTATEISVLKQRSYAANAQLQTALEYALSDVVYAMNAYAALYNLTPDGDYNISFEWDDSIQTDKESETTKRLTLVQNGISSKVEFRMWYYGETEEQALQALAKVQAYNDFEAREAIDNYAE
ncbi:MAG: hypothetical protein J1F01_05630 [Oscillospiraceae bacterium]|nr:hypothetical protein [Oscillospiraceae bacterium]